MYLHVPYELFYKYKIIVELSHFSYLNPPPPEKKLTVLDLSRLTVNFDLIECNILRDGLLGFEDLL
jgi:hypothetical protein